MFGLSAQFLVALGFVLLFERVDLRNDLALFFNLAFVGVTPQYTNKFL